MSPFEKPMDRLRQNAQKIFQAGLAAVEPAAAVKKHCRVKNNKLIIGSREYSLSDIDHVYVIGAGKATAPMAAAVEELLGDRITDGIINVKYGHVEDLHTIRLIEAGHPVPDVQGQKGAADILNLIKKTTRADLVLCLISGGGSALLPLPVDGISLEDKQQTIKVLLACGANIHEINTIRKHISKIKGGRLAQAIYPATLITLILSDVVGDDLDVIASGPTVPDTSTFDDCLRIIQKYTIEQKLPETVIKYIREGLVKKVYETPNQRDAVFKKTHHVIIGSNMDALVAAEKEAKKFGYNTMILSSMMQGETRHAARVHTAIAKQILKTGDPVQTPACVLSGGETTVTLKGTGKGGRNQEFALASVIDISNQNNIVIFSSGTDGNDGETDAAGAIADSSTLSRATEMGMDPDCFLENNDSYHFFKNLDDLVKTGPTHTNVMDLRVILVDICHTA